MSTSLDLATPMTATPLQTAFHLGHRAPMDGWLRLAEPIQARYDAENAASRLAELRSAIFVGLVLYNVYNFSSVVLLADSLIMSVALRLGLVTSTSLALVWLIGRTSPRWTERLVTLGILNAYLVPVFLFWVSHDPSSLYTFGELPLTIVYANMLLALRFPNAVVFTSVSLAITLLAVATKTGLDPSLRFAFSLQIVTACTFAIYANYRQERRRCSDYLATLEALVEARNAHADRIAFRDLSRTDALTRLPNRRHLTERLEDELSACRALTVLMVDIDHFKLYNDAFGHPAGDECLQRVSETFAQVAAEAGNAFCARFGGEEFTFVLSDCSELDAARFAQSVMQAIAQLDIPHPARYDGFGVVTVSIGIAHCSIDTRRSLDEIIAAADRALYAAKKRGRNCFAFGKGSDQSFQFGR
ncbi:GGDEF domain-containing protein [Fulvimarina sp. 2208YS6-2-32]|uniref:diguanylate cyclase n=1 Tax=Fulvimarina uroteuthidis TaxID=3098149 RepID=A0ABU5HY28_9HYPH|nr:GGDEF domain-containing protein [Fulvimarina sp. 2208YS6-2-32]MDY8107710.1 GGDEF domain-containing protein [Fulvimarina sp. 2208YS6-2-32]